MSESCTVKIVNNSGRSLDGIAIWHTSGSPEAPDLVPDRAVINQKNVSAGATLSGTASLTWGSPTDYWTMGVLFSGDGTTYLMTGFSFDPYKEYEVSDGSTITFTVNGYTSGTTNQADITIAYTGDDGGSALLMNPTVVTIVDIAKAVVEVVAKAAE